MAPLRGIKCPHLILGVFLPKKFWAENVFFTTPFCDFIAECRYLQIGTRYRIVENGAA